MKTNRLSRDNRGFSLLEVLITLTITILIFSLVSSVFVMSQNSYRATDVNSELSQNGRIILDRLVREIRQAQKITTSLPLTNTTSTPSEIQFQDGHDQSRITYVRYYINGTDLNRQEIAYYFPEYPDTYVLMNATAHDAPHNPPTRIVLNDRVVGQYLSDIEFWGSRLINISLHLSKNNQTMDLFTAVYGRNL